MKIQQRLDLLHSIKWSRSEDHCADSKCGRFDLEPKYNHGTRPWAYTLHDRKTKKAYTAYTQADGKQKAQWIVDKERERKNNVRS